MHGAHTTPMEMLNIPPHFRHKDDSHMSEHCLDDNRSLMTCSRKLKA